MSLYFAYGSNMDPKQMEHRCPGAKPLGPARLEDYRLAFVYDSPAWGGGVGQVLPAPGEEVWGVLWDLTDAHVATLDEYEGVASSVYERTTVSVDFEGRATQALIYISLIADPKPPSGRYLSALVRGAKAYGLPDDYVARLRSLMPSRSP